MITRPSPAAADALAQIAKGSLWTPVEAFLRSELDATYAVLRSGNDDRAIARAQGSATLILRLLELANPAKK